jgi:hypothetical protein
MLTKEVAESQTALPQFTEFHPFSKSEYFGAKIINF